MNVKDNYISRLLEVGIALSSVKDLDSLLDLILKEAQELAFCDGASLFLVEKDKLAFKAMRSKEYFNRWGEEKTRETFKAFEMPLTKMSIAGYAALTGEVLNIPDVRKIPEGSRYRYDPTLDDKYGYRTVSLLVVPMKNRANKVIGVLELINALEDSVPVPFNDEAELVTRSFSSQAAVAIQNARLTEDLKEAHFDTIFRLSVAAEFRDKETSNHIKRVSHYARIIAGNLGYCTEDCSLLFWAAPMHDIGKLGIPDSILHKPGKLDPNEREVMEKHTVIGANVLKGSEVPVIVKSRIVALTHHEKFDGTGYPMRLKGKDIPYEGRLVALADVFDALSSKRVYKPPMPEQEVLDIIEEGSGAHFDPEMVECLVKCMGEIREIRSKYEDKPEDFDKMKDVDRADLKALLK